MVSGYSVTKRLFEEKPGWSPVVSEALEAARKYGEFAGSWVLKEVREKGKNFPLGPGLRTLAAFGILERTKTSRSGRRAFYVMPDPEGVERALIEFDLSGNEKVKLEKEVKKSRFGSLPK